jgi:carbon-monoxide dehydrogenase small subunit
MASPTEHEVLMHEGNICRSTGYHNIVKAILAAADATSGSDVAQAAE